MARRITTEQAQAYASREWPNNRPAFTIQPDETIEQATARCRRNLRAGWKRHHLPPGGFPTFLPGLSTAAYIRQFYAMNSDASGVTYPLIYATSIARKDRGRVVAVKLPARWNKPAPFLTGPEVIIEEPQS